MHTRSLVLIALLSTVVPTAAGCGGDDAASTSPSVAPTTGATTTTPTDVPWTEQELRFSAETGELHGILSLPATDGPHVAIVLAAPSVGPEGGEPSGVADRYTTDMAHRFARAGYAALRYDPAGVGLSGGVAEFRGLSDQADDAIAALRRLRELPSIHDDRIGLWGASQQAWVIAMAAAEHPDEVAFVIAVSGSGVSAAEQQIHGIEAQSRAAGLSPDDVERAVLVGRLLVDWQLTEPMFRDVNRDTAERLGAGPWDEFASIVYGERALTPADALDGVTAILTEISEQPWAVALYLDTVIIPAQTGVSPEQAEAVRADVERTLLADPGDHLSRVTSPVLAFFGEDDIVQKSEQSARLYQRYLDEAGNDDVTIVMLPDVDHDIVLATPGYWDRMSQWLALR